MFKCSEKDVDDQYKVYSVLLDRTFDTIEDAKEAETKYKEAEEKKKQLAEQRRSDAKLVQDSIEAEHAAAKKATEDKSAALKEYEAAIKAARDEYAKKISLCDDAVKQATAAKKGALREFLKNHPEGYHDTITDENGNTITYNYGKDFEFPDNLSDSLFSDLIESFFKLPFKWF